VRFMTRILDVPEALRRRGVAPEVRGEATLSVRDDLFPENEGPFRLRVGDGRIDVEPAGASTEARGSAAADPAPGAKGAVPPIPIGALSALYAGYMTSADLARAGLVRGDEPALDLLGRAVAGPAPWITDFF